jgi:hypothetical protein
LFYADSRIDMSKLTVTFRCFSNVLNKYVLFKAKRYSKKNRDTAVDVLSWPQVR